MPARMVTYSLQQLRAWRREHPGATDLPMVLAVVLHQGPGAWTAPLDLRDAVPLPDDLRPELGQYLVGQRMIVLDLTRQPEIFQAGPASLRVATRLLAHRGPRGRAELLRVMRSDLQQALHDRGSAFREAVQRYTFDVEPDGVLTDIVDALEDKEGPMRRTAGQLYDELIAQGVAQGVAQGEVRGQVGMLLRLGGRLFGEASDRVRERLGNLNAEQVSAVADRLMHASTWDEALG